MAKSGEFRSFIFPIMSRYDTIVTVGELAGLGLDR